MPEIAYDDIKKAWESEVESKELQDLADLRLSKMIAYLSQTRLALAETPSEDRLEFELLTQEVLNLEFMLRDLLVFRRNKIIQSSIDHRRPLGTMTLAEEEFHNRLVRGFEGHEKFLNDTLAGAPSPTMKKKKSKRKASPDDESSDDDIEYVLVRFLKAINDAFVGLDEVTYGPFKQGDIATIPTANARLWLKDGTVTRIVVDEGV